MRDDDADVVGRDLLRDWTEEDQAAIQDPSWRKVSTAAARATEAEVRGDPDTVIGRLWREAWRLGERITARALATVDQKRRALRGARARRAKRKTSPSDPDASAPVLIGALDLATDLRPFVDAVADLIATRLFKEST